MATIFPTTTAVHDIAVTDHATGDLVNADSLTATVTEGTLVPVTYVYGVDAEITRPSTGTYVLTYDATVGGSYKLVVVVVLDGNTRTWRTNYVVTAT